MGGKITWVLLAALALQVIGASHVLCPSDTNCVCGGTLSMELNCNVNGRTVMIDLLPNTYLNIKCTNATSLDYSKLPKCANTDDTFKSVSFKDCPLPDTSFKEVLTKLGVSKTMALIFQNAKNLSGYFDRKHFAGLHNLTKLLLSVNGMTHLPENLFTDINKLTWLNIRSNSINLTEGLLKPLERLETLEISHNHMTNISSNLFSHLSYLRKLSLWQSNVTWFSKDFFSGVDVLEELDLSSNGLNELPASIFKPLKKLKKLTLFSNKFSSLPQQLFQGNDELETVIILNNDVELRELPKSLFKSLPNLKQIYVQRCCLETIPYDVFANSSQITGISLAYNQIKSLPGAIFNDQINLIELDLSCNKLEKLHPKLFTSLVRLETLNLGYNHLTSINGLTFSPLLSLLDLNMEFNDIKSISSYLFSNNRQRMSISLAHNQLDFENKTLDLERINHELSPFANIYNLKLLNLSHNHIKFTYKDWWINGHDILDISNNYIPTLWGCKFKSEIEDYRKVFKKPLKEIWIAQYMSLCGCGNKAFIEFLTYDMKTRIADINNVDCTWSYGSCNMKNLMILLIFFVAAVFFAILSLSYFDLHKQLYQVMKKTMQPFSKVHHKNHRGVLKVVVEYCKQDEEFIMKDVIPDMRSVLNVEIQTKCVNCDENHEGLDNILIETGVVAKFVIFSQNYLTTNFSKVNIKNIRGEMKKMKNTIHIFIDVGPENSIYAFLKEQRDDKTAISYADEEFWSKLQTALNKIEAKNIKRVPSLLKKYQKDESSSKTRQPVTKITSEMDLTQMQV